MHHLPRSRSVRRSTLGSRDHRRSADIEYESGPALHLPFYLLGTRERSVATITIYRAGLRVRLRNVVGSLSCMARQSSSERRYVTLPSVSSIIPSWTQIC